MTDFIGTLRALCRWSPGKHPTHIVHVEDVAGSLWACAEWMAKTGRKEADSIAGEEILFKNDKSKIRELQGEGVVGLVSPDTKCIAPAFNLVSAYFSLVKPLVA